MKFSDLPAGYFVVIKPEESVGLLVKDTKGRVRRADYSLLGAHNVSPETEVQQVRLK